MRKFSFVFVFLPIFLALAAPAEAVLLTVKDSGELVWKVLAFEDSIALASPKRASLTVKEVAVGDAANSDRKISLNREGEKVTLAVDSQDGEKALDVSNLSGDLVEIEERPEVRKVTIGLLGNQFTIEQGGISALTSFPIDINPAKAEISVSTPTGSRFLSVLPKDALDGVLKAKVLNKVNDSGINLLEDNQELTYEINGTKTLNVFNLFEYDVPVKASVSAVNGEITFIEQPQWLKIVGFLFS